MKKVLPLLLFLLISLLVPMLGQVAAAEPYDPPTITVDTLGSVTPNSLITVRVTVVNTTGTRMWRTKVSLDIMSTPSNIRQYLEFFETESYLTAYKVVRGDKDYMEPGETQEATFRIQISSDMPAATIPIYTALETEIGLCEEGCAPFYRSVESTITVERNAPNIFLELDTDLVEIQVGDCDIAVGSFSIPYVLTNTSQTTAFNVYLSVNQGGIPLTMFILPQMPLTSIKAGTAVEGTIYVTTGNLSPGTYTITANVSYDDYYGKTFYTSEDITISIVNDAYLLYSQAEVHFYECEYDEARALYIEAMGAYELVDNEDMALRCQHMLRRIDAIEYHFEALDAFNIGDYTHAKELFTLARQSYVQGEDCTGASLCAKAIIACESAIIASQQPKSEPNSGGGSYLVEAGLGIVIIGLVGYIVMTRKS
jgi:hypothetical protein